MSDITEIFDLNDERVDVFCRLTEIQLRNRLEPQKGIFIAESPKVIKLALDAGYEPVSLLMDKRHIEGQGKEIIERTDVPVYTATEELLEGITGYKLTRGVLCAMKRPPRKELADVLREAKRIAVLENITDATNLGAIMRSAAALNTDAVLITPSCCDPLNRRAVRVSMGTVFQIPWAYACDKVEDWPEKGIKSLHELGFKTAAMALSDDSVSLSDERLKREDKLAVILGTEGDGLTKETIAKCDYTVKIPMSHGVDSLNVAAASAVAFWELNRSR